MADSGNTSTRTVLILFFCLIILIILLFFLYKKLNREASGEYTVRRMVYKDGGVRDRVRGAAIALGTRLRVPLWPRSVADEYGEEMQEIQDEEARVKEGNSHGSDSEDDDKDDEVNVELCCETKGKEGNTSDDGSYLESSEEGESIKPPDQPEENIGMTKKGEEREEEDGGGEGESSEGPALLIDLKQLSSVSGGAIWSEEDVTPL